jgi:hypothetical protein
MELENGRRSTNASVESPSEPTTSVAEVSIPSTEENPSLDKENENRPTISSKALPEKDKSITEEAPPEKDTSIAEEAPPEKDASIAEEAPPEKDKSITEEAPPTKDEPNESKDTKSSNNEAATVESFAAASDIGSRFYIKRQIIVGNVSKFIPSGNSKQRVPIMAKRLTCSNRAS